MHTNSSTIFHKDFSLVVIGQIISLFGNAILRFALPLYLLRETGSSSLFGMVTACSFIPMIIMSLLGGVLADRVNKRNIMVLLDFTTAFIIIAFYYSIGQLPIIPIMIVALMLLYGISGTYQPAVQASIPALVSQDQIMKGNALINMVSTLANLLGPVLGGVLFGAWGLKAILLISIICFFASAIMEIFIHIPYEKREKQAGVISIIKADMKESWQYVKNEKPIFIKIVAILALFNLVLSSAMIVGIPIIVVNILGMSDSSLGFTQGALGLGGLAGGLLAGILATRLKLRHGFVLLMVCSVTVILMGLALLPFVPTLMSYLIITLASFTAMGASTLFTIQMSAVVQQQTPPHLIGKIMAAIMATAMCSQPIGQALYGIIFDLAAAYPWIILLTSAFLSLCISLYSKNVFLRLEKEQPIVNQDIEDTTILEPSL